MLYGGGKMTSYQKRKREIAYLEQCITELRVIAKHFAAQVPPEKRIEMIDLGTFNGDSFITPYNNSEFTFELVGM